MPTGITEYLGQQVASRVHDLGMRREIGCSRDETAQANEAFDSIQRAEFGLDVGQQVRYTDPRCLLSLLKSNARADDARIDQLALEYWQHTGAEEHIARADDRDVAALGNRGGRKLYAERCDTGFDFGAHAADTRPRHRPRWHNPLGPAVGANIALMQLGALIFPTEYSITPGELARAMEERGLEALVFPEHTHIPASRRSPYPSGGELPKEYSHTLDPFVACTAAATVTTRLRVGTGIALVVERDPILLAKEVASIDLISGGRFDFGIGAGWNREEMSNHGTDPRTRFALMEERVEAMRAIWTSEEASYKGRFVNFERIWSWPKPVQSPHPPILLGGAGTTVVQRAARYADVWMPISRTTPRQILETAPQLASECAERGRPMLPIYLYGAPLDAEKLRAFAQTPLERLYFWLPSADADTILPLLDRIAGYRSLFGG